MRAASVRRDNEKVAEMAQALKIAGVDEKVVEDRYLRGLEFPVRRGLVAEKAFDNGAPEEVVEALRHIRDDCYYDGRQLRDALEEAARRGLRSAG